jgi:hypothetical protein
MFLFFHWACCFNVKILFDRTGGQMHRFTDTHHHEERQGDRGHAAGFRRLRQHDAGGRHGVRVNP